MSNPNQQVLEYRGQCIAARYNQFFNPNICHVCKSTNRGNLISCDRCCLISYCSETHKAHHHTEHEQICEIIAQILEVNPQINMRRFSNWQQWIQSRKTLIETIKQKGFITRRLMKYEKEMILWPKMCIVCHQQAELKTCQRCFSANYCDEHSNAFLTKHHIAKCDQLLLLLNINIETMSGKTAKLSYEFLPLVNEKNCCEEMLEFYLEHILKYRTNPIDWIAKDYIRSDYLSGPLTIYFMCVKLNALQIINHENVVIHIVGTTLADKLSLPAWEILFHLVPEILNLEIVMTDVGFGDDSCVYELCKHCTKRKKQLQLNLISMSYRDFTESSPKYQEPNLILGFNVMFIQCDTGSESALENSVVLELTSSLFLNFSQREQARATISNLTNASSGNITPTFYGQNRFCGLAPHKDVITGDIYYLNEYLVAYICHASSPS